jgi:O-antigen ligase
MRAVAVASPLTRALLAFGFAAIPLYPSFISLSSVSPPGVSLVPPLLALALLGVCIAGALLLVRATVRAGGPLPVTFWPIAAYIGGWAIAALFGFDPRTGFLFVLDGALVLAFHCAIARYYDDRAAATAMYSGLLASGALVSILGLALVALKRPALLYAISHGRATATFVVPGEFAGYLLMLVPTAVGVALVSKRPWLRALAWTAAATGLAALVATFSRAGLAGLVAGGLFAAVAGRRTRRGALAGTAVLAAVAVAAFAYDAHHNPADDFSRLSIWRTGLRAVELFGLTGVGPGAFRHVYPLLRPPNGEPSAFHAHSYLLTSAAETGLVGMTTLAFMWWSAGRAFVRELAGAPPPARILGVAFASAFVATWVQGSIDFIQVVILGCWIPFMALALGAARRGLVES